MATLCGPGTAEASVTGAPPERAALMIEPSPYLAATVPAAVQ